MSAVNPPLTVERLGRDIVRLADAVGTLSPSRRSDVRFIGEDPDIQAFATIPHLDGGLDWVQWQCSHCDKPIQVRKIVREFASGSVACELCIAKHLDGELMKRNEAFWKKVCPERYRETDHKHPDFPLAIFEDIKRKMFTDPDNPRLGKSYYLLGPSGGGKTRVAFEMMRLCLMKGQEVGVLWPEEISTLKSNFNNDNFDRFAQIPILLLDDSLLTACRESKLVDALKLLVDVRMRHNRHMIITSQIGEAGVRDGKDFGEVKKTDIERISALMRRLDELCGGAISFEKAVPKPGEETF